MTEELTKENSATLQKKKRGRPRHLCSGTIAQFAKSQQLGERTLYKALFLNTCDKELSEKVRAGEITLNKAYNLTKERLGLASSKRQLGVLLQRDIIEMAKENAKICDVPLGAFIEFAITFLMENIGGENGDDSTIAKLIMFARDE